MSSKAAKKQKPIGRVKDARGREVSQLDPFAMQLMRRPGVIPPEDLQRIASEIGLGLAKGPRIMFIISLVCLGIVLLVLGLETAKMLIEGSFSVPALLKTLTPMSGVWVGPFVLWIGAARIRSEKTRRVMLDNLRCPHCGYDLRGLPTDPEDGAAVCPECGCAWTLAAEPS